MVKFIGWIEEMEGFTYRDKVAIEAMKVLVQEKFREAIRNRTNMTRNVFAEITEGSYILADEMEKRRES